MAAVKSVESAPAEKTIAPFDPSALTVKVSAVWGRLVKAASRAEKNGAANAAQLRAAEKTAKQLMGALAQM